jgi:hypothetical protein
MLYQRTEKSDSNRGRKCTVTVSTLPCTSSSLPAANVAFGVSYNSRNKTCHFVCVVSMSTDFVTENSYRNLPDWCLCTTFSNCGFCCTSESHKITPYTLTWPIPVAAPSKAQVCGRTLAGIVGSDPAGGMNVCLLWVFELSGRGICDGPIPCPEESHRLWCVSECDQVKINNLNTYCE